MNVLRWVVCAVAVVLAGVAAAEDIDIRALQAKLAAQEALLSDIEAKMGENGDGDKPGVPDGMTSLRKNATVTIGGEVTSAYYFLQGKVESKYSGMQTDSDDSPVRDERGRYRLESASADNRRVKIRDYRYTQYDLVDAKLEGKIDVTENFEAYFKFDLQDGARPRGAGMAQQYWVRWKNIADSGFGLLVGRDSLKWASSSPYGYWDNWEQDINDMSWAMFADTWLDSSGAFYGMSVQSGVPNRPALSGNSRTMQITPYWESKNGAFKWEVSFFQLPEFIYDQHSEYQVGSTLRQRGANDGVGSFSSRVTWKPVEDFTIRGSIMNLHAKHRDGGIWEYFHGGDFETDNWVETSPNNFATNLGFEYRPSFFKRLNLFASWTHGWNDGWVKDQSSDSITFSAGFDVTENLVAYALADHVRSKSKQGRDSYLYKAKGWASEIGLTYSLPYGVSFDVAWRHERMTYQDGAGDKHTKLTGNGFLGSVCLEY